MERMMNLFEKELKINACFPSGQPILIYPNFDHIIHT